MKTICAAFLTVLAVVFAVPALGEEPAPRCSDGTVVTVTGTLSNTPLLVGDEWMFDGDHISPCDIEGITVKERPPASCRVGSQFVARGKIFLALGVHLLATSLQCQ